MDLFHPTGRIATVLAVLVAIAGPRAAALAPNQHILSTPDSLAPAVLSQPSYADLVDLIEAAPLILIVQPGKVAVVEAARGTEGRAGWDLRAGWVRVYIEAQVVVALRGNVPLVARVSYLADVPLDARGKLPPLAGHRLILAARPVAGHSEMVQLVTRQAQLPWDAALAARIDAVLAELARPDAPRRITGVREASYVPGALQGAGETQIFLATSDGSPAAITVIHQPGRPTSWSVSFSEVVDASGQPPAHDTLAWYRLACFLPPALPESTDVSATAEDRAQAAEDYRLVMAGLGPCGRNGG